MGVNIFILFSPPRMECRVGACHIMFCCVVTDTIVLWPDCHWIWPHGLPQHLYYNDYNRSSTHKQFWKQSYLSCNRANCVAENQTRTGSVVILDSILKGIMVPAQLCNCEAPSLLHNRRKLLFFSLLYINIFVYPFGSNVVASVVAIVAASFGSGTLRELIALQVVERRLMEWSPYPWHPYTTTKTPHR